MSKRKRSEKSSSCLGMCAVILLVVILLKKFRSIIVLFGTILLVAMFFILLKQRNNKKSKTKTSIGTLESLQYSNSLNANVFASKSYYNEQNNVCVSFEEVVILPGEVFETKKYYISIDIDTTGLDPNTDKIIGISAVKYINGQLIDQFQSIANPGVLLSDETTEITGITNEMLNSAWGIKEVLRSFLSFANGGAENKPVYCVHYANFTIKFLEKCFRDNSISTTAEYIDIMDIATYCIPQLKSKKLSEICKAFNVKYEKNGSLSDAIAIGSVFSKMLELYPNNLTKWSLYKEEKPIKTFIVTKSTEKLLSNLSILPSMFYIGIEAKIKYKSFDDY